MKIKSIYMPFIFIKRVIGSSSVFHTLCKIWVYVVVLRTWNKLINVISVNLFAEKNFWGAFWRTNLQPIIANLTRFEIPINFITNLKLSKFNIC